MSGIEAVITSCHQGGMIREAVQSLVSQTERPDRILIVDDGSSDEESLRVLKDIEKDQSLPIPVSLLYQENQGVSAARNHGIRRTAAPLVLVLDGDDRLEDRFIESVSRLLQENAHMAAASSWLRTFGVLDSAVCPSGGGIVPFLARNCCPASCIIRRERFEQCGGYDESMRSGFEDWDFFLSLLETGADASIGIVPSPLIDYRTSPASSNIASMNHRLELMRHLMQKHRQSYRDHLEDALLGMEEIADCRLHMLEREIIHGIEQGDALSAEAESFLESPSYGDGGMASAVRIRSYGKHA